MLLAMTEVVMSWCQCHSERSEESRPENKHCFPSEILRPIYRIVLQSDTANDAASSPATPV